MARTVIPKIDKRAYWRVVEDCLVELYAMPRSEAHSEVTALRARLEPLPPHVDPGFIYHQEEIHRAADLVGRNLPLEVYGPKYDEILKRHYPMLIDWKQQQSTSA